MTERTREQEMHTTYSDMYKDAYGFRPRHLTDADFATWTDEEFMKEIYCLEGILVAEMEAEAKRQRDASKAFWDRIKGMCLNYSIDMITAIRWDMEAEDCDPRELEHYLWTNDLSWEEIDECMKAFGEKVMGA